MRNQSKYNIKAVRVEPKNEFSAESNLNLIFRNSIKKTRLKLLANKSKNNY